MGLAAGALFCDSVAQANDSAGAFEPAFSVSSPALDQSYTRTAQLEWLFGPPQQRRQSPQPSYRGSAPEQGNGGQRYIYVPSRDIFGNTTYQRVLAPAQTPRAERIDSKSDRIRHLVGDKLRAAPPAPPTNGPLLITVSLAKQQLTLYDQGIAIAQSPVSSGSRGHETPTGVFSVIQKQYFHRSNMYSSAPMPYMQRITWSGVALHGGELPGYAASHGCVRLPEAFAIRLWGTTQPGVRVIITQNEVKPVAIAHPLLFVPTLKQDTPEAAPTGAPPQNKPPMPAVPGAAPEVRMVPPANKALGGNVEKAELVGAAPVSLMETIETTVPAVAEVAIVRGGQASEVVITTPADVSVSASVNEPDGSRAQKITIMRGHQPLEFQIVDMPPVSTEAAAPAMPVSQPVADDRTTEILSDEDDAPRLALPMLDNMPVVLAYAGSDFMRVARAQRRAETEPQAQPPAVAAQPFEAQMLRPGPVSVFISRRQQRIYVRKGFEAVFDMPITVSEPGVPMGTHVFTANALTEKRDAFQWTVVSLQESQFGTRRQAGDDAKAARRALDRIQLPQEAVTRISEIVDVGATLIVTDQGPGRQVTQDNDFSVVTK